MSLNRRKFLAGTGGVSIGALAGSITEATDSVTATADLPWPYVVLDVEETRMLGHQCYYETNCASGAFQAVIRQLREKVGAPYTDMPLDVFDYGGGGVVGWGTLCGALNGAAGAITLIAGPENANALVNELMGWYTGAEFPSNESNAIAESSNFSSTKEVSAEKLPQSVSFSPLCHVSVSRWCDSSQYASGSEERAERCARLAGDVAAKTVSILNDLHRKEFSPEYIPDADTANCLTCHAPGEDFSNGDFAMGKMDCAQCHEPHTATSTADAAGMPDSFTITGNYPNPFNPATEIQFRTDNSGAVRLEVYNVLGQRIRILLDGTFSSGMHKVTWDGRCDDGSFAGQGMYIVRLVQGPRHSVHRMLMVK